MAMNYETFASDLPSDNRMTFCSAEENEETMRRLDVNQQVKQLERGKFQADMVTRSIDHVEFFADRFSTALSIYLEPPEGMVGLLFPLSASGQFFTAGQNIANNKLLVLPSGSGADIVAPKLFGSEAIGIPESQFIEMSEILCPTSSRPEKITAIEGNATELNALRQSVLSVLWGAELGPGTEQLSNLVSLIITWMGQASIQGQREESSNLPRSIRIAKIAQEYIESYYCEEIHIVDICSVAGVGVRTLQRCFQDYFNTTITEYLKVLRLKSAQRKLLAASPFEENVSRIAIDNGFTHAGRFSVEFRKHFGVSPSKLLHKGIYKKVG
jgi:AraC-like DNA-binding protein